MIKLNTIYKFKANDIKTEYLFTLSMKDYLYKCYNSQSEDIRSYFLETIKEYFILIKEYDKELSLKEFLEETFKIKTLQIFL